MGDLISRSALIEALRKDKEAVYSHVFCHTECQFEDELADDLEQLINNLPTIEAVEVVHGKWIIEVHKEYANYRWHATAKCSECHHELGEIWAGFFPGVPDELEYIVRMNIIECAKHEEKLSNFCPNCGADMRKGGAE